MEGRRIGRDLPSERLKTYNWMFELRIRSRCASASVFSRSLDVFLLQLEGRTAKLTVLFSHFIGSDVSPGPGLTSAEPIKSENNTVSFALLPECGDVGGGIEKVQARANAFFAMLFSVSDTDVLS